LVDTGSISSLISLSLAQKLKLFVVKNEGEMPSLITANGQALQIVGEVSVNFQLNGLIIPQDLLVVQNLFPTLLLGSDFLRRHNAVINYNDNTVRFYDDLVVTSLQGYNSRYNCAVVDQNCCLPKFCEAVIPVSLPKNYVGKQVLLEPVKNLSVIAVASTFSNVIGNGAYLKVLNFNPYPVTLRRFTKLAKIVFPATVASIQKVKNDEDLELQKPQGLDSEQEEVKEDELLQFLKDYKIDLNPKLNVKDRNLLLKCLYRYRDVFARSYKDIKVYKGYELKLEVKDPSKKAYTRQYPLPKEDVIEADRQINELLQQGLISQNDDCSYNSPLFLITKKDQTKRMVVDLRRVNQLLKPFITLLPKIDDILQKIYELEGAVYTSCDLYKGFYQLRCDKSTRHILGFTNPRNGVHFTWNVLPMGCSVSPAAFIFALSEVFKDKDRFNFLKLYVDDLLLVSKSVTEHLKHLELVLQTLRKNDLVLNPTKTSVGYDRIDFLGYTLHRDGICISNSKIKAIKNIQSPTNVRSLQRLFGFCNFFRKSIPHFTQKTYNMRRLLRKDVKFQWTQECESELMELKQLLISNPILRPLQPEKDVYLYVDASQIGIGACALQYHENRPYVCAYLSYSTTPAMCAWPIYQLELYAVALSLKAFEQILLHSTIHIFTDNSVVFNLEKYKPINIREKRLLLYLSQFKLNIRYIQGKMNIIADCLSRVAEDMNAEQVKRLRPPTRQDEFILAVGMDDKTNGQVLDEKWTDDVTDADQGQWQAYSISTFLEDENSTTAELHDSAEQAEGQDEPAATTLNAEAKEFLPAVATVAHDNSDTVRRSARLQAKAEQRRQQQLQLAQQTGYSEQDGYLQQQAEDCSKQQADELAGLQADCSNGEGHGQTGEQLDYQSQHTPATQG